MGFLADGEGIHWTNLIELIPQIKRDGLEQLLGILKKSENVNEDNKILLWGDEVEVTALVIPDCLMKGAKLWLGAYSTVAELRKQEENRNVDKPLDLYAIKSSWHPEMASYVIEALPDPPYKFNQRLDHCILGVEESMNIRRLKAQSNVPSHVVIATITTFPVMGGYIPGDPSSWLAFGDAADKNGLMEEWHFDNTRSLFIPDEMANPHKRFSTLIANTRRRRGGRTCIQIPAYVDENTEAHDMWRYSLDPAVDNEDLIRHVSYKTPNPRKGYIYMDSFGFGMGQSCLQVTVGQESMADARRLYDAFLVLAPILLAMSASTPAVRGILSNYDTRWKILEQGCDCRNNEERDPTNPKYIPKSRYSGASLYITGDDAMKPLLDQLHDTYVPIDEESYNFLTEKGMDSVLARHMAYLFIRDPLVVYSDSVSIDNSTRGDHWEGINSTNWHSVRFKPPPIDQPEIPFRVEMRTPEVQLTDFENASIAVFVAVFARAFQKHQWEFYLPMSMNDENLEKAHIRDAILVEPFWFRWDVSPGSTRKYMDAGVNPYKMMSVKEILCGDPSTPAPWPGLLELVHEYAGDEMKRGLLSREAYDKFNLYVQLLKARSTGEIQTCARFLRNILTSSECYKKDSIVRSSMASRFAVVAALAGAGYFRNDVTYCKSHLGRFTMDVKPLYASISCSGCDAPTSDQPNSDQPKQADCLPSGKMELLRAIVDCPNMTMAKYIQLPCLPTEVCSKHMHEMEQQGIERWSQQRITEMWSDLHNGNQDFDRCIAGISKTYQTYLQNHNSIGCECSTTGAIQYALPVCTGFVTIPKRGTCRLRSKERSFISMPSVMLARTAAASELPSKNKLWTVHDKRDRLSERDDRRLQLEMFLRNL